MAGNPRELNGLTMKIDVTEAITGLKALTREAKRATAALRELESAIQSKACETDEAYRSVSQRIAEGRQSMRGAVVERE